MDKNGAALKSSTAVLQTEALARHYGNFVAVSDVSLTVLSGEVKALIGPNGAGKTTLFNMLSGQMAPTAGRIIYKGEDITSLPANRLAHLGIGRSFQISSIFPKLSVLENVEIAVQSRRHRGFDFFTLRAKLTDIRDRAHELLQLVGLTRFSRQQAGRLSHGDQRRLEIGLVLATDPELVLLDEPTAGMSRDDTTEFTELISTIREGRTILFVEHNIDFVMRISHRVAVMEGGKILFEGSPLEVRSSPEVRRAYLGSMHE